MATRTAPRRTVRAARSPARRSSPSSRPDAAKTTKSIWNRIRHGNRQDVSFVAVALTVVFGSLLGIVVVQTMIVQTRVELDQVHGELEAAQERNRQLRIEVIELEAPARVLAVAEGRLGMIRPDSRTYLPGVDPDHEPIRLPPSGDPFGPGPVPDELLVQLGLRSAPPSGDDT